MIVIVCGDAIEAAILNNPPGAVVVQGQNADAGLAAQVETVIANGGVQGVMSFGMSGGLAPSLQAGEVVVCRRAVGGGAASVYADARWAANIAVSLNGAGRTQPPPFIGTVGYSRGVVATAADKAAVRAAQGADAVDMETWVAASVAAKYGLPFVGLRAVSDPYDLSLPPAALAALSPTGRVDVGAVVASLAEDDAQLPALLKLAEYSGAAGDALASALLSIGTNLGFPEVLT